MVLPWNTLVHISWFQTVHLRKHRHNPMARLSYQLPGQLKMLSRVILDNMDMSQRTTQNWEDSWNVVYTYKHVCVYIYIYMSSNYFRITTCLKRPNVALSLVSHIKPTPPKRPHPNGGCSVPPQLFHFSLGLCLELRNSCAVRKCWALVIPPREPTIRDSFFMAWSRYGDPHDVWVAAAWVSAASLALSQLSAVPSPFLAASEKEHQSPTQRIIGSKGKKQSSFDSTAVQSWAEKNGMFFSTKTMDTSWKYGFNDPNSLMIFCAWDPSHPSAVLRIQLLDLGSAHGDIVLVFNFLTWS